MKRIIKKMENKYLMPSLDLIETVFTELELITRNNRSIPVCKNCQKVYSINQFMNGVEFD